jgi:prolyl 3-hydroxylase /prolyl 3,4-dihydroxylase
MESDVYVWYTPPLCVSLTGVAVQPGKSFHDVEEVYTAEHPRLAISGWFHVPQPGEEGYQPPSSTTEKSMSSLEQLTTLADDKIWSFAPTTDLPDYDFTYDFTAEDFEFLGQWINEVYLTPDIVEQMSEAMQEESVLELPDFLVADVATKIHSHLTAKDRPPYQDDEWAVAGPPHKHRFRYSKDGVFPGLAHLFQHPAFQKWLFHVTGMEVSSHRSLSRHFRPGNDYTLATEHKSPVPNLEATLSLTPSALRPKPPKKIGISAKAMFAAKETGWTTGEFGGYEVYLAPGDDEDPAVYKSSEGGDDGVLFSSDAGWNSLSLVLRDEGLLKFVKYVSKAAFGGRWDVTSEWTVKKSDDDDEEENEEGGEGEEDGDGEEEEWTGIPD